MGIGAILITLSISSLRLFRPTKPERVSIVVEACYQNPGLAISTLLGMFHGKDAGDAIAVPILYGTYEAIILALFCVAMHYANWTFVHPNEVSLCQAVTNNYQKRGPAFVAEMERHLAQQECHIPPQSHDIP